MPSARLANDIAMIHLVVRWTTRCTLRLSILESNCGNPEMDGSIGVCWIESIEYNEIITNAHRIQNERKSEQSSRHTHTHAHCTSMYCYVQYFNHKWIKVMHLFLSLSYFRRRCSRQAHNRKTFSTTITFSSQLLADCQLMCVSIGANAQNAWTLK